MSAIDHWTEVLGSERLTGAALDRLTHRCHILEVKGEAIASATRGAGNGTQSKRKRLGVTRRP